LARGRQEWNGRKKKFKNKEDAKRKKGAMKGRHRSIRKNRPKVRNE